MNDLAKEFLKQFEYFIKEEMKKKEFENNYKSSAQWTGIITKDSISKIKIEEGTQTNKNLQLSIIGKTLVNVFQNGNYYYGREYYNVDNYVYEDLSAHIKSCKVTSPYYPHCWKLSAVVEHENDYSDWTDELIKLLYLKADLKVLIGYSAYPNFAVNFANKIIETIHHEDDCGKYLLLFGKRFSHDGEIENFEENQHILKESKNTEKLYKVFVLEKEDGTVKFKEMKTND